MHYVPYSESKIAGGKNRTVRRWADKGKSWAQSMLGQKYEFGLGVEQSYQQAKELYKLAASQGQTTAQYNLGNMHKGEDKLTNCVYIM